jgi:hypothetical protein
VDGEPLERIAEALRLAATLHPLRGRGKEGRMRYWKPGRRAWANVQALTTVSCDTLGEPLRAALEPYRSPAPDERESDSVEIHFTSSGYDDPGVCSGPPEVCSPAESDEERLIERVVLYRGEVVPVELPQAAVAMVERDQVARKAVDEADLPDTEPDPENSAYDRSGDR